ncbi:protein phosphatase 1, regulatory (inhibitor) subunit 14Ab [Acipenser oxyrinchus oxyrinchus]|uniref:Protein phosphatase 1, regulatory (Inhibitor) subunit 14Ab n=1 Tax=Acipenser oxyrinchus oxyrinchus TaxID=40147 RepID=A0AAD8CJC4_ACIOX|nr:protein phosphatase 1, regulatory (inhibitor) subunit 14Ab [Acipenser oxyrinchus oxyrinchus]
MAANRVGRRYQNKVHSPNRGIREQGLGLQRRQARVTVKYDRKELQKRLDVEKWIDDSLAELYSGRELEMPEVNIDGLLDLLSDQERGQKLQDMLHLCNNNTEPFIKELVLKLSGLQKQEELHKNGIEPHH